MFDKKAKISTILSYTSIAITILSGLLYTPWMVKQIGQSQYGLYTLATSVIALFLVDFGLSSAVSRYVAVYHAKGDEERVNAVLGAIYRLYLVLDAIIFLALIIVYFNIDNIYVKLSAAELEQFKVVYCISGIYSLINFPLVTFNGILTGYDLFLHNKIAEIILRITTVVLVVIALTAGWGLYALVTANAIAGLISIAYRFIVIKNKTPIKVSFGGVEKGLYQDIFKFSIWVTIASLAQRLVFNITPSILGIVASSEAIAVFGIVTSIEAYTYLISTAINGMFTPKISKIYAGNDEEKSIMPLLISVGKFQFFVNGAIVAGFAALGEQFIDLWMGSAYSDAYLGIVLVIIPGAIYNSLQIAHTTMVVQKKMHVTATINVIMGITNIILCFILSRYFDVIGACIAIFVSYTLRVICVLMVYPKILKIDIKAFIQKCYLKLAIPLVLSFLLGYFSKLIITWSGWSALIVRGIVTIVPLMAYLFVEYRSTIVARIARFSRR